MVAAQPPEAVPEQIQITISLKCQTDDILTDRHTDCYMGGHHGTLREFPENKDNLLRRYYLNGGRFKAQ